MCESRGMAACFVFIRLVSVGVFDSDEFDIFHFQVLPLEGDPPWGFPGVRVDGVFWGSLEFVVVKGGNEQEGLFIGFVEGGQTFESRFPGRRAAFGKGD